MDSNYFFALTEDEAGDLWVLTGNRVFGRDRALIGSFRSTVKSIHMITLCSRRGRAFIRGMPRTYVFAHGRKADYPIQPGWRLADDITLSLDGTLWLKLRNGAATQISGGRWSLLPPDRAAWLNRDSSIQLRSNRKNSSEQGAGPAGWRQTLSTPGLFPDMPYRRALLEDSEGNIWLGTDAHGLYRLRGRRIDVLSVEEGLPDRNIYPIFQSQDGAVWIGTLGNGLCRYLNGRFTTFLPGVIKSLGEDREGRLWVNGDPYRQVNERLVQVAGGLRDPSGIRVTHEDRRGVMWLGGSDGLRRKEADGSWRVLSRKDGLAGNDIEAIADARDGGMWAAGMGGLSYVGKTAGYELGRNRTDCRRTMYAHSTRTPAGCFGLAPTMAAWAGSTEHCLPGTRFATACSIRAYSRFWRIDEAIYGSVATAGSIG